MWWVVFAAGAAGGAAWRRHRRRVERLQVRLPALQGPWGRGLREVAVVLRRAAVTSVASVQAQARAAFRLTAVHYAPVPCTFIAAMSTCAPAILGTAFCSQVCLVSGFEMGRVLVDVRDGHLRRRAATNRGVEGADAAADANPDSLRERALAMSFTFGAGALGFLVFQDRWIRGPLRGTLSVFGAAPILDQCASWERLLVAKLASVTYGTADRAVTLSQLASGRHLDAHTSRVAAAAELAEYAKDLTGLCNVLTNVDQVFGEWAQRYVHDRGEMKAIADAAIYPKGTEPLVPLLEQPSKGRAFEMDRRDIAAVLAELRQNLGEQRGLRALWWCVWGATGAVVGYEATGLR